jgi:hypothetical protein
VREDFRFVGLYLQYALLAPADAVLLGLFTEVDLIKIKGVVKCHDMKTYR